MSKISGYSDNLFLVIMVYHKPRPPTEHHPGIRTEQAGWVSNPANWIDVEVPEITTKISHKKLCEAAVIIDIKKDKLVKNRYSENKPEDILAHFKRKYADRIPTYKVEEVEE